MATQIKAAFIADSAIIAAKLATDAVTTAKIQDSAITSAKIGASQVVAAALAAGAVTNAKLAAGAVDSAELANGAIDSVHFAAGAVDSAAIAANAVTGTEIAAAAVNSAELAAQAVTAAKADLDGTNGNWDFTAGKLKVGGVNVATTDDIEGLDPKRSVHAATTAALPACTYANGTAGVGATLTGDVNGAFPTIDTVAAALNNFYIVKDQVAALQNGWYKLTQVGDAGTPFILTRMIDADTDADLTKGAHSWVEAGSANGQKRFVCTAAGPTIGTSAVTIALYQGAGSLTASSGVQRVGDDFSLDFSATNPNLEVADGGVRLELDGSSLERAAGGARIKDLGVSTAKLAALAVTTAKIAAGAVTSAELGAAAVTTAKLAADAVDKTIINADVAGAGITQAAGGELDVNADGSTLEVVTDQVRIKDLGVSSTKIASDAVTSAKLASNAVTTAKVADDAITGAKLSNAALGRTGGGWDNLVVYNATASQTNFDMAHGNAELSADAVLVTVDGLVMEYDAAQGRDFHFGDGTGTVGDDEVIFETGLAVNSRVIIRHRDTTLVS